MANNDDRRIIRIVKDERDRMDDEKKKSFLEKLLEKLDKKMEKESKKKCKCEDKCE
jgi:hypothetical protein